MLFCPSVTNLFPQNWCFSDAASRLHLELSSTDYWSITLQPPGEFSYDLAELYTNYGFSHVSSWSQSLQGHSHIKVTATSRSHSLQGHSHKWNVVLCQLALFCLQKQNIKWFQWYCVDLFRLCLRSWCSCNIEGY